jgi:hypothetical protein
MRSLTPVFTALRVFSIMPTAHMPLQDHHQQQTNIIIDASAHFGSRGGSQFEGDPLPSYRLGSTTNNRHECVHLANVLMKGRNSLRMQALGFHFIA